MTIFLAINKISDLSIIPVISHFDTQKQTVTKGDKTITSWNLKVATG
jgi:hypothetical protein